MNSPHISSLVRRTSFSVSAFALLGMLLLPAANAQPGATSATQPSTATQAEPAYSSSQPSASDALKTEISSFSAPSFGSFSSDPQYGRQTGPRRTYGRPTYSDKWTNSDGSNKYGFAAGGGFTVPSGSTGKYYTTSWHLQFAGVRNFNKRYGLQVEYDYDHFGVTSGVLAKLATAYTNSGIDPTGLDGNAHLWSFSVNPIFNYYSSDRAGAYVIGGVGFYRKITNFTLPTASYYCSGYYGCYPITQNQTFDHYSNNAFGVNIGTGVSWKLSEFANAKLYAEARYVWVDNSAAPHSFFPPNNYRTGYFPITVGIRW
ncbi:MAG: hypothetical protein ACYC46_14840 [Acidobacteriaceae bacterium]